MAPRLDRAAALRAGLEPELVAVLRSRFAHEHERIPALCQEAAAWVLGRRSIARVEPWDLVASLPRTDVPEGLRRTTGETLIQLVVQATRTLRLAAPFIDQSGLSFMAEALAAATARGVRLEILLPTRSTRADDALDDLTATIAAEGRSANFAVSRLREDAPWAHLKVLTSDSKAAYIGSANVTGAGIGGRNLELGVLVRGEPVIVVERVLDIYRGS
ncbi:phospholipase D-like domain-containing protein [Streptomyces sp. NPDC007896]|uniref:phospholipase D-like domain-containing protein n=1 Tax=Streptomyces sp. NPDC007896 TaxID=3364784 RepID=UPI0036ED38B2